MEGITIATRCDFTVGMALLVPWLSPIEVKDSQGLTLSELGGLEGFSISGEDFNPGRPSAFLEPPMWLLPVKAVPVHMKDELSLVASCFCF